MTAVLVVEPDPTHRAHWTQSVRAAGFEPVVADGEWALACIDVEPLAGALVASRQWDQPAGLLVERCRRRHVPVTLVSRDPEVEGLGPEAVGAWLETSTREPAQEAWEEEGLLPSRGRLEQRLFAQLFGTLVRHNFEGVLLLEDGDRKKVVALSRGRVVGIGSNLSEESLGRVLVRSGRVSEADLNAALSELRRSEGPLGSILLQRGALEAPALDAALEEQRRLRFYELFSWTRGSFRIRPGPVEGHAWTTEAVVLLVEGIRGHMAPSRVQTLLSASPRHKVPAEAARRLRRHLEVGPWLEQLDGSEPLDVLFDRAPRTEVLAVLGALHVLGWSKPAPARLPGLSEQVRAALSTRLDGELRRIEHDRARGHRGSRALPPLPAERFPELQKELETEQDAMERQSAYEILGADPGASSEEIRQAYARTRRRLDPDGRLENSSAPELLREAERNHLYAVRALQILTDPRTRTAYDLWIQDPQAHRLPVWSEVRLKERLRQGDASAPIPASDDPELRAEAWYRSGQQDEEGRAQAIEALRRLREEEPSSLWVSLRFAQLLETACSEEAPEAYHRVLAIDPLSTEAHEGLARTEPPEAPSLVARLSRAWRRTPTRGGAE